MSKLGFKKNLNPTIFKIKNGAKLKIVREKKQKILEKYQKNVGNKLSTCLEFWKSLKMTKKKAGGILEDIKKVRKNSNVGENFNSKK